MPAVFVGLGSNERPAERLGVALARLRAVDAALRVSSVYRGAAAGAAAPDYWNAVAELSTDMGISDLAALLAEIERVGGRTRPPREQGICELDLDLLLYGQRVDAPRRLPRADVLRAPFVLAPLAELAPRLRHPVTGERLGDAWEKRRSAANLERIELPADAAAAVDGDDVPRDVRGVPNEK
jgi:2-amino-4-hydroxy-6-hydroxymethyldihydropteridine diphosphokinase